jgi:hypothetical protein
MALTKKHVSYLLDLVCGERNYDDDEEAELVQELLNLRKELNGGVE